MKRPFIIILVVLVLDQILKFWVKTNMYLGQEFQITDWFLIHFTENNGMAFGMEFAGEHGKLYLSVFRIIAVAAIGYYLRIIIRHKAHVILITSVALIFSGAMGNIIDSVIYGVIFSHSNYQVAEFLPADGGYAGLLYGKVVDMFYFPLIRGYLPDWIPFWGGDYFVFFRPVFNIADSAITTGVIFLIIYQSFFAHQKKSDGYDEDTEGSAEQDSESEV